MKKFVQTVLLGVVMIIFCGLFAFYADIEAKECLGCQMISEEEMIKIAQVRKEAEVNELGQLCINGVEVPYDARIGKWYVSQSLDIRNYTGELSFSGLPVWGIGAEYVL